MSAPWSALAGRFLGLPAPRCRVARSEERVPLRDGGRLPATVFHPLAAPGRAALLLRSTSAVGGLRSPLGMLARVLAEQGNVVAVVGCRGLEGAEAEGASDFEPFPADGAHGRDGSDALDWLARQPWGGGPVALAGFGWAAHVAWSTLAAARRPVAGMLVGFGARDPHAWLYSGGALRLQTTFRLALDLAAAEPGGSPPRDLERTLRHRPVAEADRVAARRIDWLRDWLAHPEADAWWRARTPELPDTIPATWLLGGLEHGSCAGLLADHARLVEAAERGAGPAPRLRLGPWSDAPGPRRDPPRRARLLRELARSTTALLDHLAEPAAGPAEAPVRVFVRGTGWRDAPAWPPEAGERVLHLAGSGRAGGDGALRDAPSEPATPPDRYLYDPADATLCAVAAASEAEAEARGDVLRYRGEPLPRACEIAGPVRVELHVESSASHTDFCADLLRIRTDGAVEPLCGGIARVSGAASGADGRPLRLAIALGSVWQRLAVGERLALEIASARFPRFDRHPNTDRPAALARDEDGAVARQAVHHDARHPSTLHLPVREA